jgi:hypothetical protein
MADDTSKVKVNTSSFTLFNGDNDGNIMLKLAYLDDFSLSVVIGAPEMNNGKKSYPKEKRESFIITTDRAAALYELIMHKVLPAVGKNEYYDGGVLLSKRNDSMFQIRHENGEICGLYYKNIDAERHPGSTFVYKFPKVAVIEKYNPTVGEFESKEVNAQFALFIKFLEAAILMGTHATTHSYRYANKYVTDLMMNTLKSMASKMGVTVETYHPYNNQQSSSGFNDLPFGGDNNMSVPSIEEVNTLDGILG